ncbi:MAG: helix-turn-helix domain-containing protein [Thermodesulfobacteriota bacterium]
MTKAGKRIIAGAKQALAYIEGDKTKGRSHKIRETEINVKAIRQALKLTQIAFAEKYAFSLSSVKQWETNKRIPEGPTKAYLKVIEAHPKIVEKTLNKLS